MKRIVIIVIVNVIVFAANARTMKDMFLAMPDSVFPYITANIRSQLVVTPDTVTTVPTALGNVTVDAMTDSLLNLVISDNISLQIGRLDDNHYIVIKTYGAPERESRCMVCDSLWQNPSLLSFDDMDFFADSATAEKRKMVEFPLIEARMESDGITLTLTLNAPLLSKEDREALAPYIRQRKLQWNGTCFK